MVTFFVKPGEIFQGSSTFVSLPDTGSEELKPYMGADGKPVKYFGKNSVVYKVRSGKELFALKIYTVELYNRWKYLNKVHSFIQTLNSEKIVSFEIYDKKPDFSSYNIQLPAQTHLLMPWIEGDTLSATIKRYCAENNTEGLKRLAASFIELSQWLLQSSFVHGDLSPDNIIVTDSEKLVLIDHDNIQFSDLTFTLGQSAWSWGYQHIRRNPNIIDLFADHFPILVLSLSLRALQNNPGLYAKYNSSNGLLFTIEDFKKPGDSDLYREIERVNDAYLQNLLRLFNISLRRQYTEIPHLPHFLSEKDPDSNTSILEMEIEQLKNNIENSALEIKTLKTDVSKEMVRKEQMVVENRLLKLQMEEIERKAFGKKRKLQVVAGLLSAFVFLMGGFIAADKFIKNGKKNNNTQNISLIKETEQPAKEKTNNPEAVNTVQEPVSIENAPVEDEGDKELLSELPPAAVTTETENNTIAIEEKKKIDRPVAGPNPNAEETQPRLSVKVKEANTTIQTAEPVKVTAAKTDVAKNNNRREVSNDAAEVKQIKKQAFAAPDGYTSSIVKTQPEKTKEKKKDKPQDMFRSDNF
jgi:serine/threonine protein kinase